MSSPNSNNLRKRKIAVLGSRSVGKTSLILQFVENHFVDSYYPSFEKSYAKVASHNGTDFDCEIIDTAGQDEYSILNPKHAIGIHGFVLVYSIASRNSFNMVKIIHEKIVDFCGAQDVGIPCVIVASKADLQQTRQINPGEGQELAQKFGAAWVETSAKNNLNVDQVFQSCLAEIETRKRLAQSNTVDTPRAHGDSCRIM